MPSTSSTLTVPISEFTATGENEVTGYLVTESENQPDYDSPSWAASPQEEYVFDPVESQYSQMQFYGTDGGPDTNPYSGPAVRLSGDINNAYGYAAIYRGQPPEGHFPNTLFIFKYSNASLESGGVQLGAQYDVLLSNGDILKIEALGTIPTTINVYVNDSLVMSRSDEVDPVLTPGLEGFVGGNSNAVETEWMLWDNWEGGAMLKTLYGWAKDRCGNVSLSLSDTVLIRNQSGFTGDGSLLGESWTETDAFELISRASNQVKIKRGPAMAWWNLT